MAEGCNGTAQNESSTSFFLYSPEVGSEIELPEDQEQSRKGRKRVRNPENWTKKHVKKQGLRKNSPMVELNETDLDCCKKKCLQVFMPSHLNKLRNEFQKMFYEEQNIYLNGLLHRHETKKSSGHPRKANPVVSAKGKRIGRPPAECSGFSFTYTLRNEKNIDARVCRNAFCTVHGFGPKRLLVLRRKLENGELEPDKRGKHSKHPSVDEEIKEKVREHIQLFPSRHSHYSRKDNCGRVYLSPELSIARLHRDFLEKHDPEYIQLEEDNTRRKIAHEPLQKLRKPIVTEHMYHDIFVTEFNIHFGFPRTDTCSKCDGLLLQIDAATDSERPCLEKTLQEHQHLAQEGYSAYKYDRQLSKESWASKTEDCNATGSCNGSPSNDN